jgi:preprotein translocase subunit SecF
MIVLAIIFLFVFKLRVGIDFTGGSIAVFKTNDPSAENLIAEEYKAAGIDSPQIAKSGDNEITVKAPAMEQGTESNILSKLQTKISDIQETSFDTIGPTIGRDLTNKAVLAVIFASLGIIFYIAYAFRRLPKPLSPWKFGVLAVLAIIHDLLITVGIFALIGHFFTWMQVDSLFITALLTVMGFSVHDTIVIYDRLRENFIKNPHESFGLIAEKSVNQTLARSINTSLTAILVLLALFLLGAESVRHLVLTLLIGMFIGTYSSIFVAAPLAVSWHKVNQES